MRMRGELCYQVFYKPRVQITKVILHSDKSRKREEV